MPQVNATIDAFLTSADAAAARAAIGAQPLDADLTAYAANPAAAILGAIGDGGLINPALLPDPSDPAIIEQLALLNDVPAGYLGFETIQSANSFSVSVKTTTGCLAVQWWDGSIVIYADGTPSSGDTITPSLAIPASGVWSKSSLKRIVMWSCTSASDATRNGNVTNLVSVGNNSLAGLTKIIGGTALTYASCNDCTSLTSLPLWPNVTNVYCWNCPSLTSLPLWPNVTNLTLNGCTSLTSLPLWPNTTNVEAYACTSLTSLPLWPNVTSVDCGECTSLTSLPLWPNVQYVNCYNCTSLTSLPLWPNMTNVNCVGCTSLTSLPLWPNVTNVGCSSCTSLTSLPLWPSLEYIECANCTSLTSTAMNNFYIGMAALSPPPSSTTVDQTATSAPTGTSTDARATLTGTYSWTISY